MLWYIVVEVTLKKCRIRLMTAATYIIMIGETTISKWPGYATTIITRTVIRGWREHHTKFILAGVRPQDEGVCAHLTHPHRLGEIKLEDGHLVVGTLLAQQAPTVATEEGGEGRVDRVPR